MSYYDILLAKQLSGGGDITVESLSVTANGTYSAPSGKAYSPVVANVPNSYTASDEGKVVSSGALVSQTSQTIDTNGTYDTTLKNSVTVNVSGGGGGSIIVGALRPDAELWKTWTYDKLLIEDGIIAQMPAYSSSSQTLIAGATIDTVDLDLDTYNYMLVSKYYAYPIYTTYPGVTGTNCGAQSETIFEIESLTPTTDIKDVYGHTVTPISSAIVNTKSISSFFQSYQDSGYNLTNSNSFGLNPSYGFHSISSSTLSVKIGALSIKGSASQYSSTAWSATQDIRYQYNIKLYRVGKTSSNVDGFALQSVAKSTFADISSATHTLT